MMRLNHKQYLSQHKYEGHCQLVVITTAKTLALLRHFTWAPVRNESGCTIFLKCFVSQRGIYTLRSEQKDRHITKRHFQMHILEIKWLHLYSNFTKFCCQLTFSVHMFPEYQDSLTDSRIRIMLVLLGMERYFACHFEICRPVSEI